MIHWNILDKKRENILPTLSWTKEQDFYLAGGTGLALQFGHRDSIDFDFFKKGDIDIDEVIAICVEKFSSERILIIQKEKNTVSLLVDNSIKISFFGYQYDLVRDPIHTEYFEIASIEDIAAMKLVAITSRSLEKDYVDLYFILQKIPLDRALSTAKRKIPILDEIVLLKSLTYFNDIEAEPVIFKEDNFVSLNTIEKFLKKEVRTFFNT